MTVFVPFSGFQYSPASTLLGGQTRNGIRSVTRLIKELKDLQWIWSLCSQKGLRRLRLRIIWTRINCFRGMAKEVLCVFSMTKETFCLWGYMDWTQSDQKFFIKVTKKNLKNPQKWTKIEDNSPFYYENWISKIPKLLNIQAPAVLVGRWARQSDTCQKHGYRFD